MTWFLSAPFMDQSAQIFSYVTLKAHQQQHRPSDLNTAGDQADAQCFPGHFVMNACAALEVLTEMGRRLCTLCLAVPARLVRYMMQRPHSAPAGLEGTNSFSTIQESIASKEKQNNKYSIEAESYALRSQKQPNFIVNEVAATSIAAEAVAGCKEGAGMEDAQSGHKIQSCSKDSSLSLLLHHSFYMVLILPLTLCRWILIMNFQSCPLPKLIRGSFCQQVSDVCSQQL